jgi:hypothetical protein
VFSDERSPGANLRVVEAVPGAVPLDLTPKIPLSGDREADWSPDGRWVLFRRNYDLLRVSADGSLTEPVLRQQAYQGPLLTEADWQPCVAGVTISCRSGSAPGSGPGTGGDGRAGDRAAPSLRWLSRVRVDRRGRARVRFLCNEQCKVSLRLRAKLRSGKTLAGPTRTISAPAGRRTTLTLTISRRGRRFSTIRVRSVTLVGTVKDPAGNRRSVRRAVSLATVHRGR